MQPGKRCTRPFRSPDFRQVRAPLQRRCRTSCAAAILLATRWRDRRRKFVFRSCTAMLRKRRTHHEQNEVYRMYRRSDTGLRRQQLRREGRVAADRSRAAGRQRGTGTCAPRAGKRRSGLYLCGHRRLVALCLDAKGTRSRPFRLVRPEDRQALRRPDLGSVRRQQGRRECQGTRRFTRRQGDTVVASCRNFECRNRRAHPRGEHPAPQHRRRQQSAAANLRCGERRRGAPGPVYGDLLLLRGEPVSSRETGKARCPSRNFSRVYSCGCLFGRGNRIPNRRILCPRVECSAIIACAHPTARTALASRETVSCANSR